MASLDSTWDLRSTSCPRSLAVYLVPSILAPSVPTAASSRATGPYGGSTNPFDRTANTSGNTVAAASARSSNGGANPSSPSPLVAGYCVVFGTERGSIHYRTYPSISSLHQRRSGYSTNNHVAIPPIGGNDSSAPSVKGIDFVHSLHQPIDYNFKTSDEAASYTPSSSIVACIRPSVANQPASASLTSTNQSLFLLLKDDHGAASNPTSVSLSQGAYAASLMTFNHHTSSASVIMSDLPRMSCASYHPKCGFVYACGKSLMSLPAAAAKNVALSLSHPGTPSSATMMPNIYFEAKNILKYNVRSSGTNGESTMAIVCDGHVAVVPTNNNQFYAISGVDTVDGSWWNMTKNKTSENSSSVSQYLDERNHTVEQILSFQQSSQVHPSIVVEIPTSSTPGKINTSDDCPKMKSDVMMVDEARTSLLFIASGRECAVVEIFYGSGSQSITVGLPRHGITLLSSPILAAVGLSYPSDSLNGQDSIPTGPLVAVLTSDGLVHTRSPSCIGVPLSTIEVGARPNDYFCLRSLPDRQVVAGSYSGEGRLISFHPDTLQDLADRLMKLSIDAFGTNFPRAELAEALMHSISFSATSYVGPEPTERARQSLRYYLETLLGLNGNFEDGDISIWFLEANNQEEKSRDSRSTRSTVSDQTLFHSPIASTYLCATALLCLVCTQLKPANASLSCRATKACAMKIGTVVDFNQEAGISNSTIKVCEIVADQLLHESNNTTSKSQSPHLRSNKGGISMEFVEGAVWLYRACGQHEKSITVLQERMNNPKLRNKSKDMVSVKNGSIKADNASTDSESIIRGGWTQIKYDSFVAAHLSELWSADDSCRDLVLSLTSTRELLERNPRLGISIFTASHPKNEHEWIQMGIDDDPLLDPIYPMKVVDLLKSITSLFISSDLTRSEGTVNVKNQVGDIPIEISGRALVVCYLESAIGISAQRPIGQLDRYDSAEKSVRESVADLHDELAYMLLEGVVSERSDDDKSDTDSYIGSMYRSKLNRFLAWPSKVRSDRFMASLPISFMRETALCLGKLGRHKDAIRILYSDLKSLDLALEYCDNRFEQQEATSLEEKGGGGLGGERRECAYLPLVSVALESDHDSERGIAAVLSVLSLRKEAIDRAAVLRLLPEDISVSQLAKGFLIPALIDGDSQVRRLMIMTALLRAKYVSLKKSLTDAQIKSQSFLRGVPALRELNLGHPIYSSKAFKARFSNTNKLPVLPDVMITKHFFQRYVIIQATINNTYSDKTLADASLIVAESSDEALLPSFNVPIKTLPPNTTASSWYVLAASPQRLDLSASLACEVRFQILAVDSITGVQLGFNSGFSSVNSGSSFVEEMQDITIRHAEFEG